MMWPEGHVVVDSIAKRTSRSCAVSEDGKQRPKSGVSKCEARRIPFFPHAYPASSQASCLFTQGARISITCALVADPSIRLSLSVCDLFS